MNFCKECENMLYIKLNKDGEDKLIYYCRNCGHEDESLVTNLNNLYVSKTNIKKASCEIAIFLLKERFS